MCVSSAYLAVSRNIVLEYFLVGLRDIFVPPKPGPAKMQNIVVLLSVVEVDQVVVRIYRDPGLFLP